MYKYIHKLNEKQLDKLADIFNNIGTVALAGFVVESIVDRSSAKMIMVGFLVSAILWINVLLIMRAREDIHV